MQVVINRDNENVSSHIYYILWLQPATFDFLEIPSTKQDRTCTKHRKDYWCGKTKQTCSAICVCLVFSRIVHGEDHQKVRRRPSTTNRVGLDLDVGWTLNFGSRYDHMRRNFFGVVGTTVLDFLVLDPW
jgi:transposase